jgi:tRNA pseudouridine55 synthase
LDGILNLYKPAGMTSYDVIRIVKKVSGERKVGHTGTLDPLAEGVLPVFLGKYTKLIPSFNLADKTYRVSARLGARSTTQDREGDLTMVPVPPSCTADAVTNRLLAMVGEIEQTPPMFSAVKVDGRRLYQYAREGVEVRRNARVVVVYAIEGIECRIPEVHFIVRCSKGTYVRALVDDLGRSLGTAAYLTALVRIRCGDGFHLDNTQILDHIKKLDKTDLQKVFIDPEYLLIDRHLLTVTSDQTLRHIAQGRAVEVPNNYIRFSALGKAYSDAMVKDGRNRLVATGRLEFSQDGTGRFYPLRVFL